MWYFNFVYDLKTTNQLQNFFTFTKPTSQFWNNYNQNCQKNKQISAVLSFRCCLDKERKEINRKNKLALKPADHFKQSFNITVLGSLPHS